MSAIAGCYWFDDRPASPDDLRLSAATVAHRARYPFAFRSAGPIVVGYAADDAGTAQPFHDSLSQTTLIVDGRIDNLGDVAAALSIAEPTLSGVVLAAWQRWGVELGARLLGDFVVLVVEERDRRITCIRDPMGQRPLFYGTSPRAIILGSEPQQIVTHPAMRAQVNDGMVAEYLTGDPVTISETLWRDVHRLPPASALAITPGAARASAYWDFDSIAAIRCASDAEYAARFHDLFVQAVDCRVRGVDHVGVFLSGGIDSSSVAGVAQSLRSPGASPVHGFTLTFSGQPCDESLYAAAVMSKWLLIGAPVKAAPPLRADLFARACRYLEVPPHPNSVSADPLRVIARSAGLRVVLTGVGGDDFYTGESSSLRLLQRGQVLAWGRAIAGPLLSDRARDWLRPVFGARRAQRSWIRDAFAAKAGLDDRLRLSVSSRFPTREQQHMHQAAVSLVKVLGDEMEDRTAQALGIDQRHPFYDRRVAEFGLAIPAEQRGNGHEIKTVIRRALADYLPPEVAARTTLADKAEFSSTYVAAIEALGGAAAFKTLRTEAAGWVDGSVVRRMHDDMIRLYSRGDDAYIGMAGSLWSVAALELWLEALEMGGSGGALNTSSQ